MPLFDHFHPARQRIPLTSIHSGWIGHLTESLNEKLPRGFVAVDNTQLGLGFEIDIGVLDDHPFDGSSFNGASSTAVLPRTFVPAPPRRTCAPTYRDNFEVKVYGDKRPDRILAAIELVSPSNKDRPLERAAFVSKCAGLILDGTSVMIVDVVSTPRFNLHHELMVLLEESDTNDAIEAEALYATSYSSIRRGERGELDYWGESLAIGESIPTLPLRIVGDLFVPVDLESTYMETRRGRRLS